MDYLIAACTGLVGGIVLFIFSNEAGHYRNNRKVAKFLVEVFCGTATAAAVAPWLADVYPTALGDSQKALIMFSFSLSLGWKLVTHMLRHQITSTVLKALGKYR